MIITPDYVDLVIARGIVGASLFCAVVALVFCWAMDKHREKWDETEFTERDDDEWT